MDTDNSKRKGCSDVGHTGLYRSLFYGSIFIAAFGAFIMTPDRRELSKSRMIVPFDTAGHKSTQDTLSANQDTLVIYSYSVSNSYSANSNSAEKTAVQKKNNKITIDMIADSAGMDTDSTLHVPETKDSVLAASSSPLAYFLAIDSLYEQFAKRIEKIDTLSGLNEYQRDYRKSRAEDEYYKKAREIAIKFGVDPDPVFKDTESY